jgi:hypothetical protein
VQRSARTQHPRERVPCHATDIGHLEGYKPIRRQSSVGCVTLGMSTLSTTRRIPASFMQSALERVFSGANAKDAFRDGQGGEQTEQKERVALALQGTKRLDARRRPTGLIRPIHQRRSFMKPVLIALLPCRFREQTLRGPQRLSLMSLRNSEPSSGTTS